MSLLSLMKNMIRIQEWGHPTHCLGLVRSYFRRLKDPGSEWEEKMCVVSVLDCSAQKGWAETVSSTAYFYHSEKVTKHFWFLFCKRQPLHYKYNRRSVKRRILQTYMKRTQRTLGLRTTIGTVESGVAYIYWGNVCVSPIRKLPILPLSVPCRLSKPVTTKHKSCRAAQAPRDAPRAWSHGLVATSHWPCIRLKEYESLCRKVRNHIPI